MDDGLHISNLPDWRYAGKQADSIVLSARSLPKKDGELELAIILQRSPKAGDHVARKEYVIENGYLIPRYSNDERAYRRREEELLVDRVQRFFYACQPGLDANRTGKQITQELHHFDESLRLINEQRHLEGKTPLDFSSPEFEMTARERQLIAHGADFVGHAVNRLGRLGRIILQGNRHGVKFEHDDAYVLNHSEDIIEEFKTLWIRLAFINKDIVRCVKTRDGKPDYDGIFADLIREIGKPLQMVLNGEKLSINAKPEAESHNRRNIITKIGYTLEAIDETAAAMKEIYQSPEFSKIIKQATSIYSKKGHIDNDLCPSNYRGLLQEFVEVCRARACIKSEDADNFNPVASRIKFLENELGYLHAALFESTSYKLMSRSSHDPLAENAIQLLKRGVALMGEMAELRMPRNKRALDIHDRDKPEFAERDASSVGRFKDEIQDLMQRYKDRKKGFSIS